MSRFALLSILLLGLLAGSCSISFAGSWEPVDGPYSREAALAITHWIEKQVPFEAKAPSPGCQEYLLYRNLFKGALIWAYTYGSSFSADDFLRHFSNRDDSLAILRLDNGGLLLSSQHGCFKISRDRRRPEASIDSEVQPSSGPRDRWFVSAFNDRSEISFYFSEVGPVFRQPYKPHSDQ